MVSWPLEIDVPDGPVGFLGAGRHALEVVGYCHEEGITPAFFIEEAPPNYEREPDGFDARILTFEDKLDSFRAIPVLGAVGSPDVRQRLVERWPGQTYATLKSRRAWISAHSVIGQGSLIAPMAAINTYCEIGMHVLVNVGAIVSHDVTLGNYATLSPGCRVGGCVSVGRAAFLGIGSTVRDRVTIGDGAVIAAGAVVVDDVGAGQIVMGVPAEPREE